MTPRLARMVLAILVLAASAARAQPAPQPGPPQQVLEKNLFGEREPGDDPEEAEPPPNASAPEAAPPSTANPSSAAYDTRIRQSYAAAESFQGRFDGGWIVSWKEGDLMQLQLVDKGKGQVEGAWRDLRNGPGLNSSGLLDPTPVTGGAFDAVFGPEGRGARAYRLTVRPTADGRLAGALHIYDEIFDVTLRRAP